MALFDSSIPADVEAVKLGAQRIRELKGELDTIFGAYLNDDGTWKNNVLPGAALIDASVTRAKLASDVFPVLQVPTGAIQMFAGSAAPTNYVLCDGTNYDGTSPTYAALFALIGTTYGNSGGASHFNVPDLRGRVAVMPDGGTSRTPAISGLGVSAGEATHLLTTPEIPAHTHTGPNQYQTVVQRGSADTTVTTPTNHGDGQAVLLATGSTGGGGAHNNVQPSFGLNFIIRL